MGEIPQEMLLGKGRQPWWGIATSYKDPATGEVADFPIQAIEDLIIRPKMDKPATIAVYTADPAHHDPFVGDPEVDASGRLMLPVIPMKGIATVARYGGPKHGHAFRSSQGNHGFTVTDEFSPIDPVRALEFCQALTDLDVAFETAAMLWDDVVFFASAKLGQFEVLHRSGRVDVHRSYLNVSVGWDGQWPFQCDAVDNRTVCENPIRASRAAGGLVKIKNTSNWEVRMEAAEQVLGMAREQEQEFLDLFNQLAQEPMTLEEFNVFTAQILSGEDDVENAAKFIRVAKDADGRKWARLQREADQLIETFQSGSGNRGEDRADALNAVTDFLDHQKTRIKTFQQKQSAFKTNLYGGRHETKHRALKLLTR
jgi:hypothetical protein